MVGIISILFMIIFLICFIIAIINLINNFTWGLLIINLVIFAFIIFLLERFVSMKEEFDSYKGLNKENIEMKYINNFVPFSPPNSAPNT